MKVIFAFFLLFFSISSIADNQPRPTQPARKIATTPPANYSMCVNSTNVCVDNATYNQTNDQIFNDYCSPDDEYFTKVSVSFDCKSPNPKKIQCFRCTCPPNQLRDLETHLCIPEQYCMYGIRDHVTGGCWPADCAYGDCPQPHSLEQCVLEENAVLRSTSDPMQDECVCPVGSNWSVTLSQCISCSENEEFDDFAGVCMPKNCDIKPPPDAAPDYDPWKEMLACSQRHARSQDRAWTPPIYVYGYCWSPHELMTTFCNEIYQDCKFYNLYNHPELSDQKRVDVCKEPPKPKSSTPTSSTPSSIPKSSVASSKPNSSQASEASASASFASASASSVNSSFSNQGSSIGEITSSPSQSSQGVIIPPTSQPNTSAPSSVGPPFKPPTGKGKFDDSIAEKMQADATAELKNKIDSIKVDLNSTFALTLNSGATIQDSCWKDSKTNVDICVGLAKHTGVLEIIGKILVFVASILAFFIVLRR